MQISILIANYNNGHYIQKALDSISQQTHPVDKIIIVDDHSTDNSVEIIEEYQKKEKKIELYINDKNYGCGYTKRKLIELAKSEILAFLDPDDALHPQAIEYSIAEYHKKPDIIGTHSKFTICNAHLKPIKDYQKSAPTNMQDNYFLNLDLKISHFFTFKKNVYEQTEGIDPYLKRSVDQDLYLKLYEKGKLSFINKSLYFYRLNPQGISTYKNKYRAKVWHSYVIFETAKRRNIEVENIIIKDIYLLNPFIIALKDTILSRILNKIYLLVKKA